MNRVPAAARRLIEQVRERAEDATVETDDMDGFGISRTIRFDEETSRWLAPAIEVLAEHDDRLAGTKGDTLLAVTFVADSRADFAHPFALEKVLGVIEEEATSLAVKSDDDPQPTEREVREADLQALSRADLDEQFPDYAAAKNREALIASVLADEFPTE